MAAAAVFPRRLAGNAARVAIRTIPQTTERTTVIVPERLTPESDLPVLLLVAAGFTAEVGRLVTTRISLQYDIRIAAEVAAGKAAESASRTTPGTFPRTVLNLVPGVSAQATPTGSSKS